jgi:acetyl-CoA acyltransferase
MPQQGREVAIVDAVRTGIGRGHPQKGQYREVHANELLGTCYSALFERTGLDPAKVDDVIAGCVSQYGEQSINVARNAWLQAGLPDGVPAMTVDRQCGSGQQAFNVAAALVASGVNDVMVAGGVEHMGHVPFSFESRWNEEVGDPWPAALREHHDLIPQGVSAELVADRWQVTREEMDALSLRSHRLADRAWKEGRFDREVVPVATPGGPVAGDQGIRPDTDIEALAALRPAFKPDGRVTAGNSSQLSDGAGAILVAEVETAKRLGLRPIATIVDQVAVGVDPVLMLSGPIPATTSLLERNELRLADIARFEVNEAFASVLAMWQREFDPDMDRVNAQGGAIALGHPLGCSGARLLTTLAHQLDGSGGELGMAVMCCRGGLGTGTLLRGT